MKKSTQTTLLRVVVIVVLLSLLYNCVLNKGMFNIFGSKPKDGIYLIVADWCGYSKKYMNELKNSQWKPDYVVWDKDRKMNQFKSHIDGFPSVLTVTNGNITRHPNPWEKLKSNQGGTWGNRF